MFGKPCNSLLAAKMRYVAVSELGGKQLIEDKENVKNIKILDSKGNVIKCVEDSIVTL